MFETKIKEHQNQLVLFFISGKTITGSEVLNCIILMKLHLNKQ